MRGRGWRTGSTVRASMYASSALCGMRTWRPARDLNRLRTTPGLLAALRQAGRSNAARYPLSATAKALTELGHRIS